jgi:hypothetical protein
MMNNQQKNKLIYLLCLLELLINIQSGVQSNASSSNQVNILFLVDTDTNQNQWPVVINWAMNRIRGDCLLPTNYSVK